MSDVLDARYPLLPPDLAAIMRTVPTAEPVSRETIPAVRARAVARMTVQPQPWVHTVVDRTVPGPAGRIPVRIYKPGPRRGFPVLVYAHGGGWAMCDLETHDALCREIANRAGIVVVAVDYRLAPEDPFPAAVEDFYAAATWVVENAAQVGGTAERVAVGGDSAGGNLAAAACLMARDRGGPSFALQWLAYPALDGVSERDSWTRYAEGPLLSVANARTMWRMYAAGTDLREPYLSPLHAATFVNLPPALILAPQYDHGHDDAAAYAQALEGAGVRVTFSSCDGMPHGFLSYFRHVQECSTALDGCCGFLADALQGTPHPV
ncbi:MAG: alpha/beta hydrolase [Streptomycetaceae bacterium]|nr:alpha/beta hydrolase [Streptomycetaceae bacterium]